MLFRDVGAVLLMVRTEASLAKLIRQGRLWVKEGDEVVE